MKRAAFKTRHATPAAFRAMGAAAEYHYAIFQPCGDRGGNADVVAVNIPEGAHELADAMQRARQHKARVLIIADTREQAKDAARTVAELLPEHRRVSLERAEVGAYALQ